MNILNFQVEHIIVPREVAFALFGTFSHAWGNKHVMGVYGAYPQQVRKPLWSELRAAVEILALVDPGKYGPAEKEMSAWEKLAGRSSSWMGSR